MLPEKYRFQIKNETGVSITPEVRRQGVSISSSTLAVTYATWSADLATGTVATGAVFNTPEVDNSSNGYHADNLEFVITTATGTVDGDAILYFQGRGSATGEWPEDESGWPAIVITATQGGVTLRDTGQV